MLRSCPNPNSGNLPQSQSQLHDINTRIQNLIQETPQGKDQRFEEVLSLICELKSEVLKKRQEINDDYYLYTKRLQQGERVRQKTLKNLLLTSPGLKEVYEKILYSLSGIPHNEILQRRMINEVFEDLLNESIDENDFEIPTPHSNPLHKDLDRQTLRNRDGAYLAKIFSGYGDIKSLNLSNNVLQILKNDEFASVFMYLTSVQYLDLSSNTLGILPPFALDAVFDSLPKLKALNATVTSWSVKKPEIHLHFAGKLSGLLWLDLSGNPLNSFETGHLQTFFSHLESLRYLSLWKVSLDHLSPEAFQSVFSPLKNLRSLRLSGDELDTMDRKSLTLLLLSLPPKTRLYLEPVKWDLVTRMGGIIKQNKLEIIV